MARRSFTGSARQRIAEINSLLASLLARLSGWIWRNLGAWSDATGRRMKGWFASRPSSGTLFKFEALEPRILLSADVGGAAFARNTISDDHPPVIQQLMKESADVPSIAPTISVLAAPDIIFYETPVHLGGESDPSGGSTQSLQMAGAFVVSGTARANSITTAASQQTSWTIGQTATGTVPSITVVDSDGSSIVWSIGGKGTVVISQSDNGYAVQVSGGDAATQVGVTASGGDNRVVLASVNINGPIKSFNGTNADLSGAFTSTSTIRSLILGDANNAHISTAGTGLLDLTGRSFNGVTFNTTQVADVVKVTAWAGTATAPSIFAAAGLNNLTAERDFTTDLALSGVGAGLLVLGNFKAGGSVGEGHWSIAGRTGNISFGSSATGWRANIKGAVSQLAVSGDLSGQLAVASLQMLQVSGSARNFTLLVGADLGSDGVLGGTGSAGDKFSAGTLARVRITGNMVDSSFQVGTNPVNDKFDDGNDVMLGSTTNRIQELYVGGALSPSSRITAPAFPSTVNIHGATVNPLSLPQLSTKVRDIVPPQLSAHLAVDTGASDSDHLTSNPTISGTATDTKGATTLRAALDPIGAAAPNSDVSVSLRPDGSFQLSAVQLAGLAAGGLVDGAHVIRLVALDEAGNQSSIIDVAFVLDRVAPAATAFDLDPGSDSGATGDQQTESALVTLRGIGEPGTSATLSSNGAVAQIGADGSFQFGAVALNLGANQFSVSLQDAAGNSTQRSVTITRISSSGDTVAPTVTASLVEDTGVSQTDRVTQNPEILGNAADNLVATKLYAILDPLQSNASSIDISNLLQNGGTFRISAARLAEIAGGTLSGGAHTLRLSAADAAGNQSAPVDVAFMLDTTAPLITSFAFAAADASNAGGDQTASARAQIKGIAEAGATITLASQGISTVVGAGGLFVLPDVNVAMGDNLFVLTATDVAGNTTSLSRTLNRVAQQKQDTVLAWNAIALDAIKLDVSNPTIATRMLAIQSIAVYDTLAAIEGTPAFLVQRSVTGEVSAEAAVTQAAYRVLDQLYPGQRAIFASALAASMATISDGAAKAAGIALGDSIATSVLAIRAGDGYLDFATDDGSTALGQWRPTGPLYMVAQDPQWKDVTPFVLTSGDEFRAAPPPALDSAEYAASVEMTRQLGVATGSTRTPDQTQQAQFWADGGGSVTPPGHWNQIAAQVAATQGNSMSANARLMAQLNVALADAAIACWDVKYTYDSWRPVTAIQNADKDGNDGTTLDAGWQPLLITPPHPEYVSGHSTFSAAAADILTTAFGKNVNFSTTSSTLPGVTRSFTSFDQAAQEAGESRIYGGIHFEFSNQAGQELGKKVGDAVLARFAVSQDTQAPIVVIGDVKAAINTNLTLAGQVLDNLSGVSSLQYRIDGGVLHDLAFDASGKFGITTTLALDGSADGEHTIGLLARDAAGNLSAAYNRTITLDTLAPSVALPSLHANDELSASSRLTGIADPTGSSLVSLSYSVDGGASKSIPFDATTGAFDQSLPIGNLGFGNHTLTLKSQDAAGNLSSLSRVVNVAQLAAFNVSKVTPADGSSDVGTTFRPQVYFSRAVNTSTLTAETFYATSPDGGKLDTTIVPALDGSFAWLFFTNPMPGGSTITLHVKGSGIRAAQDGVFLDADGDGASGGEKAWSFTTVSTATVAGTKLVGRVVDPGPDLQPMTFDDVRRGPDGVIHTPDDIFQLPIAHARVFVVGRPDLAVFTDENGNFAFDGVPVGDVKVGIDGRSATNPPSGVFFPEMVMDVSLRPGVTNTLMSSMGTPNAQRDNADRLEVYLPRVPSSAIQDVSDLLPTTITVDAKSAPGLTEEQRNELTLTIPPGTAVGSDGKILTNVKIGVSTVPSTLVKDMLPPGVMQHTFDITIQAPGVDAFSAPLKITFPNVFDALPGTQLNILSFDHTTGRLVINGTATVSNDGKTVVSDEGVGIVAPGWHGLTPPGSETDGQADNGPDNFDKNDYPTYKRLSEQANNLSNNQDVMARLNQEGRKIQGLGGGYGDAIFDDYSVSVRMPPGLSPENFLAAMAKDLNGTVNSFIFNRINVFDVNPNPKVGDIYHIDIAGPVDGDVILSEISADHFIFQTVTNPQAIFAEHPEYGAREFGFERNADGSVRFYTRGASQPKDLPTAIIGQVPQQIGWNALTSGIGSEIQRLGGTQLGDTQHLPAHKSAPDPIAQTSYFYLIEYQAGTPTAAGVKTQIMRGKTGTDGRMNVYLPSNVAYRALFYNPVTGLSGEQMGETQNGRSTNFPKIHVINADNQDTDHDTISDFGEYIIGSNPTAFSTTNDGISDGVKVLTGINPLGKFNLPAGIIGAAMFQGSANSVVVQKGIEDPSELIAYVATGTSGLGVLNVNNVTSPTMLAELGLSGDSIDIAADSKRGIVAVASGSGGLHLVDTSNLTHPILRQTITFPDSVTGVEIRDGNAYAAAGGTIFTIDLNTGEVRATLNLASLGGSTLTDLSFDGGTLYTMDTNLTLRAITVEGDVLTPRGALVLSNGGSKLFVGGGVAYVGGQGGFQQGFSTVNVANPANMSLLSGPDATNIANGAIVANGSGLAISAGVLPGIGNAIHVVDVSDPTRTDRFLTQYLLPDAPRNLALANGLAFVADGSGGLQVVNYAAFDTKGVAPTVAIAVDAIDVDPTRSGIQVLEGRNVNVKPTVTDDVQVRNIELLVNGKVVSNDASFPWDLIAQTPTIATGGDTMTLQVRATDTGGNTTLSAPTVLSVVPDTFAPVLTSINMANGDRRFFVRSIDLTFDEPLDTAKLDLGGATLLRAGGDGLFGTSDDVTVAIHFDSRNYGQTLSVITDTFLTPGDYRLTIAPSIIADRAGNQLSASIVRTFSVRAASDIRAAVGVPVIGTAPSANAGQQIALTVPFDPATAKLQVETVDSNGTVANLVVPLARSNSTTGTSYFNLPANVVTGDAVVYSLVGSVRTDFADGTFPLQIVPIVTGVDVQSVSADGSTATVILHGSGFVEGQNSEYRFGSGASAVVVTDTSTTTGPDVQQVYDPAVGQFVNGQVTLTVPLSNGAFGPISVKTAGGVSASFSTSLSSVLSTALSGTPADATKASANPGQAITLLGSGLSVNSDILLRYTDYSGNPAMVRLSPISAKADGSQATLLVPAEANGVFSLQMFGSTIQPVLQIVPTLWRFDSTSNFVIGSGFVEGATSYDFPTASINDTSTTAGADVSYYYDSARGAYVYGGQVNLGTAALTRYGTGNISVTTAGGTSASLALNAFRPGSDTVSAGTLADVAVDPVSGAIWTIDQDNPGHLLRVDSATGLVLQTITLTAAMGNQYTANFAGLQILGQGASIGGTSVPAGSLLLIEGYPYNGSNGVAAINPATGALIAKLAIPVGYYATGGVYDPSTGHLFLLSQQFNQMVEINASTGAEIGRFAIPFSVTSYSGMAIDPVDGNFWIGSYNTIGQLVKVSRTGAELRRVDISGQGLDANQVTGLAFAPDGSLRVSTVQGLIYKVNLADDFAVKAPTLSQVNGAALLGTAAQAGVANANVGQAIELVGTNFGAATQVLFNVRDNAGKTSVVAVRPQLINNTGTRLQVIVPDLATTGDVRVSNVGVKDVGFSSYADGVHRGQTFSFTAGGSTAAIRFADGGLETIDEESWGLDNVVVKQGSTVVFADDFEGAAKANWSNPTVNRSTAQSLSAFSGRFNNTSQTLNLSGLTAGQTYSLSFDLYALDSWDGSAGNPDQMSVSVDGVTLYNKTISNNLLEPQTINATPGIRLQIVPTLTGGSGRPGQDDLFYLQGSGFMEGATTITVGGVAMTDASNATSPFDVSGQRNDTINVVAPRTLDGPIRISTEGGFAELAGGQFGTQPPVDFNGIVATADSGIAADPSRPSATTGQSIVLNGQGLTSATLVQFRGIDESGALGTLTVTGSATSNGRALTVRVPALARTGAVSVLGSGVSIDLQVVPTLRAIGGTVAAGSVLVLEGSGLTSNDLAIQIDGRGVGTFTVDTIMAGTTSAGRDQQLLRVVVPAGVSGGVITASTAGGTTTLRAGSVAIINQPDQSPTDSGEVLTAAFNPALGLNKTVKVNGAIADGLDIDLYRVDLTAGDQLTANLSGNNYAYLRLFDSSGNAVTGGYRNQGDVTPLSLLAPASGAYYVGVSGYFNNSYNPNVSGSGTNGTYTGSYSLNLTRNLGGSHRLGTIVASAPSGTPAQSALPSANTLQTITITGSNFLPADQVVFTMLDDSGQTYDGVVTPTSIAADGASLTVVVPVGATTGAVRLARDTVGLFLQIVPTLTDVEATSGSVFNGGALRLTGSGFAEGNASVFFGAQRIDDVSRNYGLDVGDTNRTVNLTVPENSVSGPIRVATIGGTSAAFGLSITDITAVAASGTAAQAGLASAIPGQMVAITGVGLDASTDIAFPTIDTNGNLSEIIVRPTLLNAARTRAEVRVPAAAITGNVRVIGDINGTLLPLQIVPAISGLEVQSVAPDGSSAVVVLRGVGLVEGNNSEYRFGSNGMGQVIVDAGPALGPDVQQVYDPAVGQFVNGQVTLTVPLSNGAFGPISVKTAGGVSASFSTSLSSVLSTALSGTPADATKASANPGQAITLLGSGLSVNSDILLRYTDYSGNPAMVRLSPISAKADGSQATLLVPAEANGVFSLQMFGSTIQPVLQIVPTLWRFDSTSNFVIGSGFVEGATSYDFPTASINDTSTTAGADVSYYYDSARGAYVYGGQVNLGTAALTRYGTGNISVTTAGGTSASLALNAFRPGSDTVSAGTLADVAVDPVSGAIWTIDQDNPGHLLRVDSATGLVLQTITLTAAMGNQYTANFAGLQILGQGASIGGTSVPAGSLLLIEGYPYNGSNGVAAINPATGALIAKLAIPVGYYATGGVYDPSTGHLFLLSQQFNQMVEINASTGAEIGRFAIPFSVTSYSGMAIDPVDGNFWIGSYNTIGQLVKVSRTGAELRRVDISGQGLDANQVTGLAFAPDGSLRVSTVQGLIYKVNLADDFAVKAPTLSQVNGAALLGTAAQAGVANANVGQAIELVGTNFGAATQVLFNVRDNAGKTSVVAVRPQLINNTGTRLQVIVPDLATTGDVRVSNVGVKDVGFSSYADGVHRGQTFSFTAGGSTAAIRFADGGLETIDAESWGLDNVVVKQGSTVVFADDFEGAAKANWSNPTVNRSTAQSLSAFSGRFNNTSQTLNLSGLTAGQTYSLSLDLYALDSWDGSAGNPDQMSVSVDGVTLYNKTISNNLLEPQTINATPGIRLQIVPTLTGGSGRPGQDDLFYLQGSGFMEGATTITVGGVAMTDASNATSPFDISGQRNDTINVVAPRTLDGPIRVSTDGGFSELPSLVPANVLISQFDSITAHNADGAPADPAAPAANSGQSITLNGQGFTSSTLVQFQAVDDSGILGTITRTGSAAADGRSMTIRVPAQAVTGTVAVLGSGNGIYLQIVPTLRGLGGSVVAGNSVMLEASGLPRNNVVVEIDGHAAAVVDLRSTVENNSSIERNQQLLRVVVPAGVSAGVVTVRTPGGSATLRTGTVITALADQSPGDAGSVLSAATNIALDQDQTIKINAVVATGIDVDLYRVDLAAGNQLYASLSGNDYAYLRLFDSAGNAVAGGYRAPGEVTPLTVSAPSAGSYYVGVSAYYNSFYDPNVSGSGVNGSYFGRYTLNLQRAAQGSNRLTSISAIAASGSPAQSAVASANTLQSITLNGKGMTGTDRVVFTMLDDSGQIYESTVAPASVAADGTNMSVLVPDGAATGTVRIDRDTAGILLQIVPTLTDVTGTNNATFDGGPLRLTGSGFTEGNSTVLLGAQRIDDAGRNYGLDVSNTGRAINFTLPENSPSGPIKVTTIGGTSAPFGLSLTGISGVATSGTPTNPAIASANGGQVIQIEGTGIDLTTDVIFPIIDYNGVITRIVVRPLSVNAAHTQAQVKVPVTAISGTIGVAGDTNGVTLPLQIVPTMTGVDVQSVTADGSSAVVVLTGTGFIEGASEYHFGSGAGSNVITDYGPAIGPDVQPLYDASLGVYVNGAVTMTVPLNAGAFGPITVKTSGGTSTAFSAGITSIQSRATTGTPANAAAASANAGQTITVKGSGLTTASDILLRYVDYNGALSMLKLSPASALADGSEASLVVPIEANGAFALQMFGSSEQPLLQIVPTVESFNEGGNLYGSGFVEGASRYDFPSASVVDSDIAAGVDVSYFYDAARGGYRWNGQANINSALLPHHGAGQLSVTTAGGTSAAVSLNAIRAGSASAAVGTLGDVAIDRSTGAIWVVDQSNPGNLLRIDPASGLTLQTITLTSAMGNQYTANYVGLQVAPQALSLGGTVVPAGSLLLFEGYPYNGNNNVAAINPATGALIKSLTLPGSYYMTAGLFDPTSGHLFMLSHQYNQMVEINPANGAELTRVNVPLNVQTYSGIALDPVDGNLWIGSYSGGPALVKISRSGAELRRIDLTAQGIKDNEISGLAFGADGELYVASTKGAVFKISVA